MSYDTNALYSCSCEFVYNVARRKKSGKKVTRNSWQNSLHCKMRPPSPSVWWIFVFSIFSVKMKRWKKKKNVPLATREEKRDRVKNKRFFLVLFSILCTLQTTATTVANGFEKEREIELLQTANGFRRNFPPFSKSPSHSSLVLYRISDERRCSVLPTLR